MWCCMLRPALQTGRVDSQWYCEGFAGSSPVQQWATHACVGATHRLCFCCCEWCTGTAGPSSAAAEACLVTAQSSLVEGGPPGPHSCSRCATLEGQQQVAAWTGREAEHLHAAAASLLQATLVYLGQTSSWETCPMCTSMPATIRPSPFLPSAEATAPLSATTCRRMAGRPATDIFSALVCCRM